VLALEGPGGAEGPARAAHGLILDLGDIALKNGERWTYIFVA
jgi:hypothetical protein